MGGEHTSGWGLPVQAVELRPGWDGLHRFVHAAYHGNPQMFALQQQVHAGEFMFSYTWDGNFAA